MGFEESKRQNALVGLQEVGNFKEHPRHFIHIVLQDERHWVELGVALKHDCSGIHFTFQQDEVKQVLGGWLKFRPILGYC